MSAPEWKPESSILPLFDRALAGNKWAGTNSSTSGPRTEKAAAVGDASFQLYSLATPNGQKVSILLEELGIDYDAHVVNISDGSQFTSGFCAINPNSKIPAAVDRDGPNGESVELFESGSIVLYLAEKYKKFIPADLKLRAQVMNWVFWQMGGQGPMTGNFGHFFVYAPAGKIETRDYGVARYGMEVMRLTDVLDKHLEGKTYLVGEEYTIADIMCFAWYYQLKNYKHVGSVNADEYLGMQKYTNCNAWSARIAARPAVQKGLLVCSGGVGKPWLVPAAAKEA